MNPAPLDQFSKWLDEQEAIARHNYSCNAASNQKERADMFANQARCLDIARDMLLEYLAQREKS